jgi:ABC-type phosphate transport system substrate-binding protein
MRGLCSVDGRRRALALLALLCCAACARAADTMVVVVSAQSPVQAMTQKEVLALYTGRTRSFANGEAARPLDQPRDSALREAFYRALTGMDLARINSYWARLHFTGQVQPPQPVADERALIQRLRQDPNALGYLAHEPNDPTVRVVLRLP